MSIETIIIVIVIVLVVLFVLGYFGRGRLRRQHVAVSLKLVELPDLLPDVLRSLDSRG